MIHIFLSYANADIDAAELVKEKLQNFDVTVWQDRDGGIKAGDKWRDQIESGIRSSDALLILLTPESCASAYVTFEWAYGLGLGKRLIPLLWKDCEKHPRLEAFQHLDFRSHRNWELLTPEALSESTGTQAKTSIEGVWADTFEVDGDPRVALLTIRKLKDQYFVKGNEYDSSLKIRNYWYSDLSRYDLQKNILEYYYYATDAIDLTKTQGHTEISFSGSTAGSVTLYKGIFKDFGQVRAGQIHGRLVADSSLFDDDKGQKNLAKKLLDEME
jgi:hypothetical protein